ncbi:MAG: hypothetical protein NWE79_01380, partial [Candidatus Bathyarchaeota archaeon]|nr:hypothetical protein [Candidatus Bathyarchaeota archaeon]
MNPETVASSLHENERRILLALRGRGPATTEDLTLATGLSRDAVEKACAWAETKGVVSVEEEVSRTFNLMGEGREYVEGGLPEKRLLRLVQKGEREIRSLKEGFQPLDIALVWVRRNEWVTISNGRLELTDKGLQALSRETLDERLLYKISEAPLEDDQLDEASARRVGLLLKRGLLSRSETVDKRVGLTRFGRAV